MKKHLCFIIRGLFISCVFIYLSLPLFAWPTVNGVVICNATSDQTNPKLVSDGAGGAIIAWRDNRSGNADIYSQRVNNLGNTLWTMNGIEICTVYNYGQKRGSVVISDGSGGAVVGWYDYRSGTELDLYAQRVNSAGSTLWTPQGVGIVTP